VHAAVPLKEKQTKKHHEELIHSLYYASVIVHNLSTVLIRYFYLSSTA